MNIISTNVKPLICYDDIHDIELMEIPASHYIKFGDFDDIIIPTYTLWGDVVMDERDMIAHCLGNDLWSEIASVDSCASSDTE